MYMWIDLKTLFGISDKKIYNLAYIKKFHIILIKYDINAVQPEL